MRGLLTALSFLTRLAPGRRCEPEDLASAMPWLPVVGLILGGLLAAPLALGLFAASAWVQAWLVLAGSLWLTRGLHLDGLADIADAWGSGATGERFWGIVKDPRLGAFGAMGLVIVLSGQLVLLHELLARQALGALTLVFVLGRLAAVVLARSARTLARPGLGRLFISGATRHGLALALATSLGAGLLLVRPLPLAAMLAASLAPILGLRRLARQQDGLNGDFLGAAIVLGELGACLGWLLAS